MSMWIAKIFHKSQKYMFESWYSPWCCKYSWTSDGGKGPGRDCFVLLNSCELEEESSLPFVLAISVKLAKHSNMEIGKLWEHTGHLYPDCFKKSKFENENPPNNFSIKLNVSHYNSPWLLLFRNPILLLSGLCLEDLDKCLVMIVFWNPMGRCHRSRYLSLTDHPRLSQNGVWR